MPKGMNLLVALSAFLILAVVIAGTALADEPAGAKLYSTYCGSCHGANGGGGAATAIGTSKFLGANDDATIARVIGNGVPAKGMPTWSKGKGGALTDDQITSIVAYLRSLAGTGASAQQQRNTFLAQTRLVLAQSDGSDGNTIVSALLQQYNGYPVRDASVVFTRSTSWGIVEIATAKTGADGIASIVLPDMPEASLDLSAAFKGSQQFDASSDRITFQPGTVSNSSLASSDINGVMLSLDEPLLAPEGSLITPNPPLLPATILVLVVGAIWTTYGYVVSQLVGIWKQGRTPPRRRA
jgi:mono/diheme cytochrome c family protein